MPDYDDVHIELSRDLWRKSCKFLAIIAALELIWIIVR
ncbi:MAG: hypothetical protein JWO78_2295 [Micavibrio sp.]|nr:hypothetical protein [Micavibrio sp.]